MYDWYERYEELHVVFRHLQNTLFKNVTKQLEADVWKHPGKGGASQPAVLGEARMVVSRKYVSCQVQTVIACREEWLQRQRLPLNTEMRDDVADSFLDAVEAEYHDSADQKELQERDRRDGGKRIPGGVGTNKG